MGVKTALGSLSILVVLATGCELEQVERDPAAQEVAAAAEADNGGAESGDQPKPAAASDGEETPAATEQADGDSSTDSSDAGESDSESGVGTPVVPSSQPDYDKPESSTPDGDQSATTPDNPVATIPGEVPKPVLPAPEEIDKQPDRPITPAPPEDPANPGPNPDPPAPDPDPEPDPPAPAPDPDAPLMPVYTPRENCAEGDIVPLGQSPRARNFEPLGSIWCFDLREPPARTVVEGPNSWVDDFTVNELMFKFEDGDMGYRVFENAGSRPGLSQHWINQNHWMVDVKEGFTGGAALSPNRSFRFVNGKFVVEGDFAGGIPEYGRDTWGEITITTAPEPTGIVDQLYAYGQFPGHWVVGCRLDSNRNPTCAVEGPNPNSPTSTNCFSRPGDYRILETSRDQPCGTSQMGGNPTRVEGEPWRLCEPLGPDMACRDRFRMEVTQDSITLYVNGVKYFEDAGWPAAQQLPDSFINGDIHVYQSNWQNQVGSRAYRYHWDHFAVNPPNGPEESEWFGWEPGA